MDGSSLVSLRVLVIPEDPLQNGHILRPLSRSSPHWIGRRRRRLPAGSAPGRRKPSAESLPQLAECRIPTSFQGRVGGQLSEQARGAPARPGGGRGMPDDGAEGVFRVKRLSAVGCKETALRHEPAKGPFAPTENFRQVLHAPPNQDLQFRRDHDRPRPVIPAVGRKVPRDLFLDLSTRFRAAATLPVEQDQRVAKISEVRTKKLWRPLPATRIAPDMTFDGEGDLTDSQTLRSR